MPGRHACIAMVVVVAAIACDSRASVRWIIEMPGTLEHERTATIDVWIARGACGGDDRVFEASFAIGEAADAPRPSPLPEGRYAIAARALDAACIEIARGCVEVDLPLDSEEVIVPLEVVAETPKCPATQCDVGRCEACEPAAAVGAGIAHTCAVSAAGRLYCWGANDSGQLGISDPSDAFAPEPVGEASDWIAVAGGDQHTCGIREDGGARTLWCWGTGLSGQLGIEGTTSAPEPARLPLSDWTAVAVGVEHTCALRGDGELFCWGEGSLGRLGFGDQTDVAVPTRLGSELWLDVAAGHRHTCAVRADESLWCWGDNGCRQVGTGGEYPGGVDAECEPDVLVLSPVRVGSASSWALVAAGESFSCGARTDGSIGCWGRDSSGQRGDDANIDCCAPDPSTVHTDRGWVGPTVQLRAGASHVCALDGAGALFCWGSGTNGQLGIGGEPSATLYERLPTPVEGSFTALAAGGVHTCVVDAATRSVLCAGANGRGQLGVAGTDPSAVLAATCLR